MLRDADAVEPLGCYGIEVVPFRLVHDVEEAQAAAAELGEPVALKAVDPRWRHRGDLVGVRPDLVGVRPDLVGAAAVRVAYADLAALSGCGRGVRQRMAPRGTSCRIQVADDPSFDSVVSFGLAGMVKRPAGRPGLRGGATVHDGRPHPGQGAADRSAAGRLPRQQPG